MIFESMWPLLFLAAIPVIIILYLLKPKGTDYRISSNLLWQQLFRNQESKTFLEKFVHNLLMYLQILIILLLIVAFMSPFVQVDGQGGGRVTLLFDTSASMQHKDAKGNTRMEEAVDFACDYVRSQDNTRFSIVTHDDCGTKLLAVDVSDKDTLIKALKGIKASDAGGQLGDAQGLLSTISEGAEEGEGSRLIVFTDGNAGLDRELFTGFTDTSYQIVGQDACNVSSDYLAFSKKEDAYDVILSVTNHSDSPVSLDIALYEDEDRLLSMRQLSLDAGENTFCLFEGMDWQGSFLRSELSGFAFAKTGADSLSADNVSYAVKGQSNQINALLVGVGNMYVEKAYRAVTGAPIAKSENDAAASVEDFTLVIYDADTSPSGNVSGNRLLLRPQDNATEELTNVMLQMRQGDLTAGLSDFSIGVNKASCYELPQGAVPFLEYQGKCIGYYGEQNGYREVVLGFDIRESDFPLRAEFPVFMTNVLNYLADSSWLGSNVYYAGQTLILKPWAGIERATVDTELAKAGLYEIGNEEYREYYIVRPAIPTESDGHVTAESDVLSGQVSRQKTRRTLRNLFLILALILLCVEWIWYVKQMRYRGKFYLAVRLLVMIFLVLSLLGLRVHLGSNKNATIFVVDLSDSNREHKEEISGYLRDRISDMPKNCQYGIVTFGGNTTVEQFLTGEHFYAGLMTAPDGTATNLEEAVSRALTMIPSDTAGRIVFLTDGRQTRGDIRNMASAVTAGGVEFLAVVYESESKQDAYIENVDIPSYLHPGDIYSITVQVESNYETNAQIELLSGSSAVSSSEVHLNKGSNRFVFKQQVSDEAMESLRVQVNASGDACTENNVYSVYSIVEAPPKILVISGMHTDTSQFASLLSAAGCDYNVVSAYNAPKKIDQMLEYKSIFLVNTYIGDLPQGFVDNIESYVRDYGGGFVCCGGENSFALGGYRNSALETVLPVDMELRNENEIPSMVMVMVIDRSGSMMMREYDSGPTNLDLAIESAMVAVDNLRETDYVGVLTFDDGYEWQVEPTLAKDKRAIKEEIKNIPGGGGTTIKPALKEAYKGAMKCDADIRHVVLLTDGMGETSDFKDVTDDYNADAVTLSTVAVGAGSDTSLLIKLARACKGRYYYADFGEDLPRIFAQEVFLGGDSYIQNGDFSMSVYTGHELTKGLFEKGWPHLYGYVCATPKAGSMMLAASAEKEDPILTVWQYGLGRTVAWNTDVTNEWTGAYAGNEDYIQLWKRITDYSTSNAGLGDDSVNVVPMGGYTEIVYTAKDYSGQTSLTAYYVDPNGETGEAPLHAVSPGRYEAKLDTPLSGIYNLHIRRSDGGEVTNTLNTAAAVQFSDEYKFDMDNKAFLDFVDQYGERITQKDVVWNRRMSGAKGKYPLTGWFLALGILLFLADVAVRRFQYVPKLNKGKVFEKKTPAAEAAQEPVSDSDGEALKNGQDKVKKEKPSKPQKQQKKEQEQVLDTSALLKKKDDRNL